MDSAPLLSALVLAIPALAQCDPQWLPSEPASEISGQIHATAVWDPDGVGPRPTLLVVGGQLSGGPVLRGGIAAWDGSRWQHLGTPPIPGPVSALGVYSGLLVAAFSEPGNASVQTIATFDGNVWHTLCSAGGLSGRVSAFAEFQGELVVTSLAVRTTNDVATSYLFAGGGFTRIGSVAAWHVARFDDWSNGWVALGTGLPGAICQSLLVRNSGLFSFELLACDHSGGSFLPPIVRRWTGSSWVRVGTVEDDGSPEGGRLELFGGSYVLALDLALAAVRRFDGTDWLPLQGPGPDGEVRCILDLGSELVIGGAFDSISGQVMNGIARGNPGAWSRLGTGFDADVRALARGPNGDIFAGGDFTTADGQPANHVARWTGSGWVPLGTGTDAPVHALAVLSTGELVAGGEFTMAGGSPAGHVARWDGSGWSTMAVGVNGRVAALCPTADGRLFVGGSFQQAGAAVVSNVARWSTTGWTPLGTGVDAEVLTLATDRDGSLLVGGRFATAGGIAAGGIARWSGAAWQVVDPTASVYRAENLAVLPNGDLVVGGSTNVGSAIQPEWTEAVRWNGSAWTEIEIHDFSSLGYFNTLLWRPRGELLAGGRFSGVEGQVSGFLARLVAPCPAAAVSVGAGCSGSAGPIALTAIEAPWLGGAYRARASGFAWAGLAVDAYGTAGPPFPLGSLFPVAGPGCDLLVHPLVTWIRVPVSGVVDVRQAIATDPVLVGVTVRDQLLQFEFDANGAWSGLSATNALDLTIGVF